MTQRVPHAGVVRQLLDETFRVLVVGGGWSETSYRSLREAGASEAVRLGLVESGRQYVAEDEPISTAARNRVLSGLSESGEVVRDAQRRVSGLRGGHRAGVELPQAKGRGVEASPP